VNALTLRTSIIGRELVEHRSLLDWFLMQKEKSVRGFRQVVYSGVTTNQLAEVVTLVIKKYPTLNGLFQVVSKPITKYDLLSMIRDAYHIKVDIIPDDHEISNRSMKGDKLKAAIGYISPSWEMLIDQLICDQTPYDKWTK
jgi:dTDP-4-dehydrorhamnose reductase